jgi:uncharacterized protein YndB with AHSA1/START domain
MKNEKIQFKAFYAHSVSEVWEALTDPEHLREWLMSADFKAKPNESFEWKEPEGKDSPLQNHRCRVQIVEKERILSYQITNPGDGSVSIVSWTLEEKPSGTEVILEHEFLSEESLKPHPEVIMQVAPVVSLDEYRMKKMLAQLIAELSFEMAA